MGTTGLGKCYIFQLTAGLDPPPRKPGGGAWPSVSRYSRGRGGEVPRGRGGAGDVLGRVAIHVVARPEFAVAVGPHGVQQTPGREHPSLPAKA